MSNTGLRLAQEKMLDAGVARSAIDTFTRFYRLLESGASGYLREADVDPLPVLAHADAVQTPGDPYAALARTVIIKLNGGLGTSMGLDAAKSLLAVRGPLTFLDVIVGQIRAARRTTGARLPLILMNSFRTREESLAYLARYPDLCVDDLPLDFLQNREPKLDAVTLEPATWPADPELEWCPPGHGDLYPALHHSGLVRLLIDAGFRYAMVSNADNLGAGPSARIAGWFAASGAPYAAEMCIKSPADVKGGQLVVRKSDGRIIQRETAQTHPDDMAVSLDPSRHRYFHTNNLWFDLVALAAELDRTGGVLELPLIRNSKTIDPADPASTPVIQIESSMGAGVAVFDGATAIEVPRSRFLPVKTTNDLLALRSDAYTLTEDFHLVTAGPAPLVALSAVYKTIEAFDARFPYGPPSLRDASSLTIRGDWTFGRDVTVVGEGLLPTGAGLVPDGARITASAITA
jgi:UTP--glucose-1-phosphate uridylyltransferase